MLLLKFLFVSKVRRYPGERNNRRRDELEVRAKEAGGGSHENQQAEGQGQTMPQHSRESRLTVPGTLLSLSEATLNVLSKLLTWNEVLKVFSYTCTNP